MKELARDSRLRPRSVIGSKPLQRAQCILASACGSASRPPSSRCDNPRVVARCQ
jgi:hypothetical protein